MVDRLPPPARGELDGADTEFATSEAPFDFGGLLNAVFQRLSDTIAGPDRFALDPLVVAEDEVRSFLPTGPEATDSDLIPSDEGTEFIPDPVTDLPSASPATAAFDPATLPAPSEGKFTRAEDGRVIFTRGVGEAPNNKANRFLAPYETRAEFVSGAAAFVNQNFDVTPAGQWRALDANLTASRSVNSDHYSGGAFDVRAGSPAEAQRILVWASQQPWVSFAQVYPDGSLIHISANIAGFAGGAEIPVSQESAPETTRLLTEQPRPTAPSEEPIVQPVGPR